jgi:diguanylate cyclase (GGDEF)-like protein
VITRRVYAFVRAASLLTAVVLAIVWGPDEVRRLRADDVAFLIGAFAVAALLGFLRPPAAHFERSPRPTPDSDRVGLLMTVILVVAAREGWFWAAYCTAVTELARPGGLRRRRFPERLLGAASRVPARATVAPLVPLLHDAAARTPSFAALGLFVGVAGGWVLLTDLLWIDPYNALRQNRSLLLIWDRHLRDVGTVLTIVIEALWAYIAAHVAIVDGAFVGVALLLVAPAFALPLIRIALLNARLHRLALSRAAVDAMLRANDPQPQVRSLLETIDPRIVRESIEVAAFGRGGSDRWSRVVRFGPAAPSALERLGGRALRELLVTGGDTAVHSGEGGVVRAFAARDADGGLRGALVVFRPAGVAANVAPRELERAAAELGPLLDEYGAIDAARRAATVDALTGLPNRRGIARALDEAMAHVREGGRYAVLLVDVDHFKSVNDLLGHQSGDRALAQIGWVIAENIRGVDVAGRYGGEEFLVLLRDATRDRAMQIAERLRAAIETSGLAYADGKPLTISIGVAYARAADTTVEVVERADRALYRAKHAGRNRVVEAPLVAV